MEARVLFAGLIGTVGPNDGKEVLNDGACVDPVGPTGKVELEKTGVGIAGEVLVFAELGYGLPEGGSLLPVLIVSVPVPSGVLGKLGAVKFEGSPGGAPEEG